MTMQGEEGFFGDNQFMGSGAAVSAAQNATSWFIDPVNGLDHNLGNTAAQALKTAAELIRRIGPIWYISKDISVTLLNDLPATDPLDLALWFKKGGFFRLKGTPVAGATFVVGAVTALNRATNVATDFTCVALGAGQANKRIRVTAPAPRAGFLAFLGEDIGAGKYEIPPLTFYDTTVASPTSVPTAQGVITVNDTFVVDTLTSVAVCHLRILATENLAAPSANTVPVLVTDIKFTGGFNQGAIINGFPDPTNSPVFYGCDLGSGLIYGSLIAGRQGATTYASASAGAISYFGSLIVGDISFQTGVMAFLDYDTLVQSGRVRFREGGTGRIGALGIFDSTSDGLAIEDGSVRTLAFIAGVDALYGQGNAGVGVNKSDAGPNYTYVTKPTITGGGGDSKVGGTVKAWGAIPYIEPANNAAIVAFA